jgi:hypothetical protein
VPRTPKVAPQPLPSGTPRATLSPKDGVLLWGNDHPRNGILREIDAKGQDGWKNDSSTHRRSLSENRRIRLQPLGDKLISRSFECPVVEAPVRVVIIKRFAYLNMPPSVRVGQMVSVA